MISNVYIENSRLDLYKDEPIEINSSIGNINDITKNSTDYSKSFTVPATHNNNIIFKHYYDATIDNTFDARVKVNGRIELGGIPFKFGKWKLQKVNVKQNKPSSYTINFTGNLVSLKDKLKDDELSSLDFSEFDHEYNSDNVKDGLTGSLFSGNIIYNLFSKKQLYYKDNPSDNVNTATLANIAWGGGANVGVNYFNLKPSIKMSAIIEAIQTKYNITFSNDFFGRSEFADIFMWLNRDANENAVENESLINFTSGDASDVGFNYTTDTWLNTQSAGLLNNYRYKILVNSYSGAVPYKIVVKNFGVQVAEFEGVGTLETEFIQIPLENGVNTPFSYTFHMVASNSISYACSVAIRYFNVTTITKNALTPTIDYDYIFEVSNNFPKIKIIDFLKGLFSMFKLVVIADQYDNIYINTLNDYYAQGKLYDLTRYIDFNSYEVERGNILNTINFKFQEPETLLNSQFLTNTGIAYGDEVTILEDEDGQLLDGDTFDVEVPFEQIIYERLPDLEDNINTNVMYGGIFNAEISPVNPKPHLFYNSNQNLSGKTVAFIDDTNTKIEITTLNVPSHSQGFENPQFSLIFGAEFNEWNGLIMLNNLYTNYYQEFIDSIFNIKRRTFRFNAKKIPLTILTKLQLNDVIKIRNEYYRIDNYNSNLLNGETSLTLINSFNNNIASITASRSQIIANYQEQTQSVYVNNIKVKGTTTPPDWITVNIVGNNVFLNLEENNTISDRAFTISIFEVETEKGVDVLVFQSNKPFTADTNTITADTNLITADNG
jgi:hypothetical protein